MVNSRPYRAAGPILGRNVDSYHSRALGPLAEGAGEVPGQQRDAEEDQHGLGDAPHRHVEGGLLEAEPAGQDLEVEVAEERERQDLEDGVDGDQDGGRLPVPAGEVVPDQHHGDAAGQADDDQPGPVLRQVGQQQPRQGEHQRRADDPVEEDRGAQQPGVAGDVAELVVADLRQHRVHHHQQPDRDRQRDRADLDRGEGVVEAGDEAAEQQADDHRDADPHRQEPVQGGQALHDRRPPVRRSGGLVHAGAPAESPRATS